MKKLFLFTFCLANFLSLDTFAQGAYVPFNRDYYHMLERYEISSGRNNDSFHSGYKPFRRDHLGAYLDTLAATGMNLNKADRFNLSYLSNDNWEFVDQQTADSKKPFLKGLYKKPADFFYYRDSVVDIHINPVIYLSAGFEQGAEEMRFRNSRGVELRGSIDRKIAFYSYMTSTQTVFPSWVKDQAEHAGAVPGEGFWKRYNETGYGFFSARAHLSFNITRHIEAQFGHDRNFVGEGYRSMILSDFSNPYLFFKLNTKIWRFQLTNLWAQPTADIFFDNQGRPTDKVRYPKKYFSMHRLGINIGKNFNLGVFESVMSDQFDWNYLNPVIFYRWVEHLGGSPDKLMLGTDFKWNFTKGMQLYGQFALDEFVFSEFFEVNGQNSSRNKHGLQAGYKYINAFKVSNLDLQLEYNQARPYTYQEKREFQSFSNYRTALAHPLGANFKEAIAIIRYQPQFLPRLFATFTGMYQYFGDDPAEDINYGKDVLKNRREANTGMGLYGHVIGQGVENTVLMANLNLSYMVKQNVFLDVSHSYRKRTAEDLLSPTATNFTQFSIRMNIMRNDFNF